MHRKSFADQAPGTRAGEGKTTRVGGGGAGFVEPFGGGGVSREPKTERIFRGRT